MNINIPMNPCFKEIDRSHKRYIVMKGSAGSGKSVDTAQNYILRLMQDKGRNLVCIRKSDITNRDSTYAELTGAIYRMFGDKANRYWSIKQSPLQLTCLANGNQIIFRGVNDEKQREKLKSITFQKGKLTDVWIEEATEITQADFEIIDDRLRGELPPGQFYQIRMTFNPVNKNHWIKKVFFDIPDSNVLTHHSTYLGNRFIDNAYRQRMERRKLVDPEGYQIYGLGEWGEIGGLILHNWEVADISQNLNDYEKSAVRANIWNSVMPPIYRIISMAGVFFILYFGGRNVLGIGWTKWDVAAFATFLACFTKLSVKSSSAAKLFNAVHKAQVSWKRIRPLMKLVEEEEPCKVQQAGELQVSHVDFVYPTGGRILENVSFTAKPGQIIGITGPVACGKSTLGKVFLCEYPYEGSIRFKNQELGGLDDRERIGIIGYLGHDPELFNDSIENNILMGEDEDIEKLLKMVCFDKEVAQMEEGIHTHVGSGGVRLSGGQAQRLALARTLCHKKPVLILDDPFSALDRRTEEQIFANLKNLTKDSIVLLISHRLYLFPQMDQVLWMENGRVTAGTHEELMSKEPEYAAIYRAQEGGEADEQK